MAGTDATRLFNALHPPGTLDPFLDPAAPDATEEEEEAGRPRLVGLLDRETIVGMDLASEEGEEVEGNGERTPLAQIIGLPDFEVSRAGGEARRSGWVSDYARSGAVEERRREDGERGEERMRRDEDREGSGNTTEERGGNTSNERSERTLHRARRRTRERTTACQETPERSEKSTGEESTTDPSERGKRTRYDRSERKL